MAKQIINVVLAKSCKQCNQLGLDTFVLFVMYIVFNIARDLGNHMAIHVDIY